MNITQFNNTPYPEAHNFLLQCCASKSWASDLLSKRPFGSFQDVLEGSAAIWESMDIDDYMQAFSAHPKIGDTQKKDSTVSSAMSAHEQSFVVNAEESVLDELASKNKSYHDKFGFIFLVFASGKTADEMLQILNERINNSREKELEIAAAEQLKIAQQRLTKLIGVNK